MIEGESDREEFEILRHGGALSAVELCAVGVAAFLIVVCAAIVWAFMRTLEGLTIAAILSLGLGMALAIGLLVRRLGQKKVVIESGLLTLRGRRRQESAIPLAWVEFIGIRQPQTRHSARPSVVLRGFDAEGRPIELDLPPVMTHLPRFIAWLRLARPDRVLTCRVSSIAAAYAQPVSAWESGSHTKRTSSSSRFFDPVSAARRDIGGSSYSTAIAALRRAVRSRPHETEGMKTLGDAYLLSGNPGRAAAWYGRALSIAPNDPAAHAGLGVSRYLIGDYEGAARMLGHASLGGEDGEVSKSLLACSMMMNSDFRDSQQIFTELGSQSKNAALRKMAGTCLQCARNNQGYTERFMSDEDFRKQETTKARKIAIGWWLAVVVGLAGYLAEGLRGLLGPGWIRALVPIVIAGLATLFHRLFWKQPSVGDLSPGKDQAAMCWTWLGPNPPLRHVVYKEYFRKPEAADSALSRTIFGTASEGKTE